MTHCVRLSGFFLPPYLPLDGGRELRLQAGISLPPHPFSVQSLCFLRNWQKLGKSFKLFQIIENNQ